MREHGTRACYVWGPESGCVVGRGCRCEPCTLSNRAAVAESNRRTEPAYVGAEPVREHIAYLSSHGIGWKTTARAAGLSPSTVWKVVYGSPERGPSKRVRRATAEALLNVTLDAGMPGSRIDAAETWRIIIKQRFGDGELGRVRSSWPNLREGYADLDRKGRCPECDQPTPRGERFRYDEVEPA